MRTQIIQTNVQACIDPTDGVPYVILKIDERELVLSPEQAERLAGRLTLAASHAQTSAQAVAGRPEALAALISSGQRRAC